MGFTAIAVVAGLVLGLVTGGRLRHLGERTFRLWPLLVAGIVLQVPALDRLGYGGLLAAYVCLVVFALANVRLVAMSLVAVGIALNSLTIAVNHGMPVRRDAIVSAGIATADEIDHLSIDRKHHVERPGHDRLMVLSDIIPVRLVREVLSFGDVVMAVGVADVIVHLLRPRKRYEAVASGRTSRAR